MTIAVIIPTYNSMTYLRETLDSVLRQTRPPDEILVNDDGSTDGTPDFAQSYHSSIRVFRRSQQRQAASRNYAATQTQCEWIAFIDHDDLWLPNKLELQIQELARNPEAELCYTARHEWIPDSQNPSTFRLGRFVPVPPPSEIRKALYVNTTFMPGSVVMRRITYLETGGFNPSFKYVEDWEYWLRRLHAGVKFAAVREPVLLMRFHASNQSGNALAALAEGKRIYREQVLPHLPRRMRWLAHQRSQSGQESAASYVLRGRGDEQAYFMLLRSILRYPFDDPLRYKILAYMSYTRLRSRGRGK